MIAPGVDASIVPSDSLTFKTGSVKQDATYSKALTGFVVIESPDDPVKPVPVILGEFSWSLDHSACYGVGIRQYFCSSIRTFEVIAI